MERQKVIVLGGSTVDIFLTVDRLPALNGETLAASGYHESNGGKGANSAVACALLGTPTMFMSQVGEDDGGTKLINLVEKAGVESRV
jgi:ribokinase